MKFDFYYQEQPTESLDIDDMGNVALVASDVSGIEYYLVIQSELGLTKTIYYGPSIPEETEVLPQSVSYTYNQFEFNESKIYKLINKFLNTTGITTARITEKEEIYTKIRSLKDYV